MELDNNVKEALDNYIKKKGVDKGFCEICDECLPATFWLNRETWDKHFKDGMFCARCMAKRLGGITDSMLDKKRNAEWSCPSDSVPPSRMFSLDDVIHFAIIGFEYVANIVMYLPEEEQYLIKKYLKDRRDEINQYKDQTNYLNV